MRKWRAILLEHHDIPFVLCLDPAVIYSVVSIEAWRGHFLTTRAKLAQWVGRQMLILGVLVVAVVLTISIVERAGFNACR